MVGKKRAYVPDRGDAVWLNFNPIRGHEQAGRRPALVISSRAYNAKSGLALVCPITSHEKGYPFEIILRSQVVQGAILADQVRSVDWKERKVEKAGVVSDTILATVREYIQKLIIE